MGNVSLNDSDHEDRNSRHERQRDVPAPPPVNAWRNRSDVRDRDNFRPRQDSQGGGAPDRKTPDSDRNAEKEKDSHSEPEDDRDTHRYIGEKPYGKDGDFRRIERRERGDYGNRDRNNDNYGRRVVDRGSWNNNSGPRRGGGMGGPGGPRRGSGGAFQDDRDRRGGGGGAGVREDSGRRDLRDDRNRVDRGGRDRDLRRDQDRRGDRGMMDRDRDRVDRDRDFTRGPSNRMDNRSGGGYNDRGGRDQGQGPPMRRNGGPPMDNKGPRGPYRVNTRESEFYRDSDGFESRGGRDRPMPKFTEVKPALVAGKNKYGVLNDDVGSD